MSGKTREFLQYVEEYPCLYNNTLNHYSRKDIKELAWTDIAKKMNWTVSDCKEKWRSIRNGFVRTLRTRTSTNKARKPYYLHDIMQFILPYVKSMKYLEDPINIDDDTDNSYITQPLDETEDSNCTEITRPPSIISTVTEQTISINNTKNVDGKQLVGKRKYKGDDGDDQTFINYAAKKQNTVDTVSVEDPRTMFLLSLLPDIENLSDENMRSLKIEMMMLIQKYLAHQKQETLP